MTLIYTVYFMSPYFPIYMLLYFLFSTHTILVLYTYGRLGESSRPPCRGTAVRPGCLSALLHGCQAALSAPLLPSYQFALVPNCPCAQVPALSSCTP